jgi:hypothetical protein
MTTYARSRLNYGDHGDAESPTRPVSPIQIGSMAGADTDAVGATTTVLTLIFERQAGWSL